MQESGPKVQKKLCSFVYKISTEAFFFLFPVLSIKQPDGYGCEEYPDGSVHGGQFQNAQRHGMDSKKQITITQDNGKKGFVMASELNSNATKMMSWCQEWRSTS